MNVSQIMSSPPVTIDMDDTLDVVRELFLESNFHHVLVIRHGKLRGVLSDRDLLKSTSHRIGTQAATLGDLETLNKRAHQIMSRNPVSVSPQTTIVEAACLFNARRVSCLPVVDDQQRPVGIVSWRDVMANVCETPPQVPSGLCTLDPA